MKQDTIGDEGPPALEVHGVLGGPVGREAVQDVERLEGRAVVALHHLGPQLPVDGTVSSESVSDGLRLRLCGAWTRQDPALLYIKDPSHNATG